MSELVFAAMKDEHTARLYMRNSMGHTESLILDKRTLDQDQLQRLAGHLAESARRNLPDPQAVIPWPSSAAPQAELKNLRAMPLPSVVNDVLWPAEDGSAIDIGPDGVDNFRPVGEGSDSPAPAPLRLNP